MNVITIAKNLFFVSLVALFIRFALVEVYQIKDNNLAPSIPRGSYLLISKASYNFRLPLLNFEFIRWQTPQAGDLVAFFLPEKGNARFVSRVIALQDTNIQIKEGSLFLNGAPQKLQSTTPKKIPDFGPVLVPENHFFVLNDNRHQLFDSRTYGPVPIACLKGKVKKIFYGP